MSPRFLSSVFCLLLSILCLLLFAARPARAQVESVLHTFTGPPTGGSGADGAHPEYVTLLRDASGNLYGTTLQGGTAGQGAVFELVNTSGSYTERVLHSFIGASDGAVPFDGLVMDSSGNLYGTTEQGGTSNFGTVFELVNSSGSYTEKVLYSFTGTSGDGADPLAGLITDASGNLYGTTSTGGTANSGTAFELVNSSGSYIEKVLYSFTGTGGDGADPLAGLIMDASGNLYGTTSTGGTANSGTVFELVSTPASYTEKVLYKFTGGNDGTSSWAGLVMGASGNLYGTTYWGGTANSGTVFELVNTSGSYTEKVLHSFTSPGGDGANPQAGLVMGASGNLYGTTIFGGASNYGIVFGIAPVTLSASSITFGNVAVGSTSAPQPVTVTNIGSSSISYGAVSVSGANADDFAITSNGCGAALAPSDACSVSVAFTPAAATGESASLNLAEGGLTQTVSLTGTGVYPTADLSASSLSFSSQNVGTTSSSQTVTLANNSTVPLTVTSVGITGDFAIASNTCAASVPAGKSCTVGVTFSPTAAGTRTGTLNFTDNAASSPQTIALSGEGEDFALTAGTASQSVAPGATALFDLLLSPEGGFNQAIGLSCSGAPADSACTVTPTSVTLDGTNITAVQLKVVTAGTAMVGPGPGSFVPLPLGSLPLAAWLAIFGLLGLMALAKFRGSRVRRLVPFAALALLVTLWAACGGGVSTPTSTTSGNSTPVGTYPLTVTGTSGSLHHSVTVTLRVQ